MMRRHGWQRPLHPLQIAGTSVFSLLVAAFFCFLGIFLGNKSAEIAVTTIFSFAALSAAILFIRCTAIDPSDRTRYRFLRKKNTTTTRGGGRGRARTSTFSTVKYGLFTLRQLLARVFKRMERKILKTCIRRKYRLLLLESPLGSWPPLLPLFPLVVKEDDDSAPVAPHPKDWDISFCSLCDFEVQKHSKHCRTCNRCVEGFDHHCRWLNNCIGKKNYTTFILLLVFLLIMLILEGSTAIAIFIRCLVDQKGIIQELKTRHYTHLPRGVLAAISVVLFLIIAYISAALGQLFFFHVLLIRKGMRTYDYILAMKEENRLADLELFEDSDFSSDGSADFDSPEKPTFISRVICNEGGIIQNARKFSIRIEGETGSPRLNKPQGFHASTNPWKLITMNHERALLAAHKAKERLTMHKTVLNREPLLPLPLEAQNEPSMKFDDNISTTMAMGLTSPVSKEILPRSPAQFSSPRRRVSCSSALPPAAGMEAAQSRYRSSFDLQLTSVSKELEPYISRQVLCSVLRKDGNKTSP